MIGHTGDLDATIIGCTAVDDAVKVKKTIFSSTFQLREHLAVPYNITILMHCFGSAFDSAN